MRTFLRSLIPSALAGMAVGFVVLGIGGRLMMRIIAHWESRVPVSSVSGTFTVILMGTVAGIAAGLIHGLLRQFVRNDSLRIAMFFTFCVLFTLYGVHDLLLRPKLLFVVITIVYCMILELVIRRNEHDNPNDVIPPLTA